MRETLTAIAVVLLLALTAALVGPWFVDWGAHRAEIERRLSDSLGAEFGVAGPIELRLLPSPRLELRQARLAGVGPGAPALTVDRAVVELSAAPLLKGEFRFVEARLEKPTLELTLGADGALTLPASAAPDARAAFDALEIAGGAIVLRGADGTELGRLGAIEATLAADALFGPYKGQGRIGAPAPLAFRFSTGAVEAGRLRHKIVVDESPLLPRAEFEGAFVATRAAGGARLSYDGLATLSGHIRREGAAAPLAWRLSGPLKADRAESLVEPLELRIGDERPLALTGAARLPHAAGAELALSLAAKQIDIDRLLAEEGKTVSPAAALRALARLAGDSAALPIAAPLRLELAPGAVTLGGETVADAQVALRLARGEPATGRIETQLPGRARLVADGRFEGGAAPRFRGRVDFSARDARRLRDWLAAGDGAPDLPADPPFATLSAQGLAELSLVSASLREAAFVFDRSSMRGDVVWTAAVGAERARFFADLTAEALDIDAAPDLTGLAAGAASTDLSLSLDARAVRVARFGEGVLDAGRIVAQMQRSAGAVELERFTIAGLGGADLSASGALDAAGGRFRLDLDAQRLGDLAALIRRVAPGPLADLLAARAARLSPAKLALRGETGAGFALKAAGAEATLGATKASLAATREAPETLTLRLSAANPDVAALLRQLGMEAQGAPGRGPGRIEATLRGAPQGAMATQLAASLAGATLTFEGTAEPAPLLAGAPPRLVGRLALEAGDLVPLLQATGALAAGAQAKGGVDLEARLAPLDGGLAFAGLRGWAFASRIAGEARWRAGAGPTVRPRLEGALSLDRLSLAEAASLAFGWSPATAAPWPDRAYGPALADPPDLALDIAAARLDIGRGVALDGAKFRLSAARGLVSLDDVAGRLGPATAKGALALRRDGLEGAASGRLSVAGLPVAGPAATGRLDAEIDFAGAGRNVAALVAGLGGAGRLRVSGLTLPRLAPGAIEPVIRAADDDRLQIEEGSIQRALAAELDRGALVVGDRETQVNIAGGVLRAGPIEVEAADARLSTSLAYDLKSFSLDLRATLGQRAAPRLWSGSPPRVETSWRGPLDAPRREIDSGAFFNGLAARQIARDLERIEALEADIRERAAFARRAKAVEFMRRREQEVAAWEVEQARLAAEAERRRIEEEKRAAAEAERLRLEEEKRRAEEARRAALEAERQRLEEEKRRADEVRRAAEEARRAALEAERQRVEEARRAAEAQRLEQARAREAERRRAQEAPPPPPLDLTPPGLVSPRP
ncbi:MAG: AsmA family protein [Methylobacteriaceae bacterium]|nr:AsmA family protein [Methylobacteriaceae bacterium]